MREVFLFSCKERWHHQENERNRKLFGKQSYKTQKDKYVSVCEGVDHKTRKGARKGEKEVLR